MTNLAPSVLDRSADVLSVPTQPEVARDPTEVIETWISAQPAHVEVQEIDVVAADKNERAADIRIIFFVSVSLQALFVVIFVGYLVLDAALRLP
jgi:hypothetical protein